MFLGLRCGSGACLPDSMVGSPDFLVDIEYHGAVNDRTREMCKIPEDDLTTLLAEAGRGDGAACARLAEAVYADLHELAHAVLRRGRPNPTLCTTALVNESWMRIVGGSDVSYESRWHFYCTAARAMRTILVDYARAND